MVYKNCVAYGYGLWYNIATKEGNRGRFTANMKHIKKRKAGRPKTKNPKKYVVTARLSENRANFVEELCMTYDKTQSEVMRGALDLLFMQRKNIRTTLHWTPIDYEIRNHTVEEENEAVDEL